MPGVSSLYRFFTRSYKCDHFRGLYSQGEFRTIIERERARSDRCGDGFSLVVFCGNGQDGDQTYALHLVEVLNKRVRSIDEVGWFDAKSVGVLLPETSPEGARKLGADICYNTNSRNSDFLLKVYTYFSGRFSASEQNCSGTLSTQGVSEGEVASMFRTEDADVRQFEGSGPIGARKLPFWKRGMDILGALLGFILLFPLFLVIAILVKVLSPGPILFEQERVGYLGRPFSCWKFRTMESNADVAFHAKYLSKLITVDEPMIKLDEKGDPRVIPFGNFLRQTGLDELPQLFNVLRGDMSLIGPRPCIPYEAEKYTVWQRKRFDTLPGLTGLWQVSGKNKTTFKEMMRLDIKYSKKRTFWLDIKILAKTPKMIISQAIETLFKKQEARYEETN